MGLVDSLQKIIELCISIQNQLDAMTQYFQDATTLHRSLIDLSAIDVAALERNVALLSSYKEDMDYIIDTIQRISGSVQLVFWMLIVICILIIAVALYLIFMIIYEHRDDIYNFIKGVFRR